MKAIKRPIVLVHGLWNTSDIFKSLTKKLDEYEVDYYAPTLVHKFGKVSIVNLSKILNNLILEKYGSFQDIDIVGFSMGGIIARYWINKLHGYRRTKKFISIGSPHNGTLTAQLIPKFLLKGISEMKINSDFLKEISKSDDLLNEIDCISFFTVWDIMVFPGWKAHLPKGKKYSLNIFKHRNLIKNPKAINQIIEAIVMKLN